jgi:hypothetical protein
MIILQKEFSKNTKFSKGVLSIPINIINNILKNWKTTIVNPILDPEYCYVDWDLNDKDEYINSLSLKTVYYDFDRDEIYIQVSTIEKFDKGKKYEELKELIYSGKTGKFLGYGDL